MGLSKYVIPGLLVVSMCLNLYGLGRINNLLDIISDTRNQVSHLENYVATQIGGVRNLLEKAAEEERWMSPVSVTPKEPSGDLQTVTLTWQLKECPTDAAVTLYLRQPGEADFTPYAAESTGGGGFRVDFDHPIQPEPLLSITLTKGGQGITSKNQSATNESTGAYRTGGYEYYLTMIDGRDMRSTEVNSIGIGQDATTLVAPIAVEIYVEEDLANFILTVRETPKPEPYFFELQGVTLKVVSPGSKTQLTRLISQRTVEVDTPEGKSEVPVFETTVENNIAGAEVLLVFDYGQGRVSETPVKHLMDPARFF